jgi:hypothetical protein
MIINLILNGGFSRNTGCDLKKPFTIHHTVGGTEYCRLITISEIQGYKKSTLD